MHFYIPLSLYYHPLPIFIFILHPSMYNNKAHSMLQKYPCTYLQNIIKKYSTKSYNKRFTGVCENIFIKLNTNISFVDFKIEAK